MLLSRSSCIHVCIPGLLESGQELPEPVDFLWVYLSVCRRSREEQGPFLQAAYIRVVGGNLAIHHMFSLAGLQAIAGWEELASYTISNLSRG